jgi:murein DD-endopeptidase MepM/ murein hydrolase activator NlpD
MQLSPPEHMPRENWTVLLVRGEDTGVRQFQVSPRLVKGTAIGFVVAVLALSGLLVANGLGGTARLQSALLQHENGILEQELATISGQVSNLENVVRDLSVKNEEARLLAGLTPIDEEILEVGVGGPGGADFTDHPLWGIDSASGAQAFAAAYDLRALERRTRLLAESLDEAADSLRAHRDLLESVPSILPAVGRLSSSFSRARLHPIHHKVLPHEGVDLSAPEGTSIMAAAKGTVKYARRMAGYGLLVEIDHGFGYVTRYGHASEVLVKVGQKVERGDVIALVGRTGLATAAHVHYEVQVNGRPVNPMNYVLKAIP